MRRIALALAAALALSEGDAQLIVQVPRADLEKMDSIASSWKPAAPKKQRKALVFCRCEGFAHNNAISYALRRVSALPSTLGLGETAPVSVMPITSTMPVMEHTTMVSRKVPVMDTSACRTGWSVRAAAAAIGAEPMPASLENTPRATPKRITVPSAPPATACPVTIYPLL